jgi:hypothetical protein
VSYASTPGMVIVQATTFSDSSDFTEGFQK